MTIDVPETERPVAGTRALRTPTDQLSCADLRGAEFLFRSILVGADLSFADLTGANLTGVIWSDTTCPDLTNSDATSDGTCLGNLGEGLG